MRNLFVVPGLLGMLALSLLAQPCQAQGLDSTSVALLKPDRFVRIQVPDFGRVQGNVGAVTPADLTLVTEEGSRTVHLAAVDTLWVRGRRTKLGAIIGGVVGLGGGVFLGLLAEALCENSCEGDAVLTLGLLGTGTGALTGAIIGTAFPRWRRVHPR
jgi:hypothetical protein